VIRSSGPRRQTTWVGPADQGYIAVTSGSKTLIASFDPQAAGLQKPTIVRTRGQVSLRVNTAASADADIIGAYGVAVVTDRAFAAGVASIPGPFDDAGWDGWLAWRSFSMAWEFGTAVGAQFSDTRQEVDSKGMRKVSDDETVVLVAETQGGAVDVSMPLRLLFKLS